MERVFARSSLHCIASIQKAATDGALVGRLVALPSGRSDLCSAGVPMTRLDSTPVTDEATRALVQRLRNPRFNYPFVS